MLITYYFSLFILGIIIGKFLNFSFLFSFYLSLFFIIFVSFKSYLSFLKANFLVLISILCLLTGITSQKFIEEEYKIYEKLLQILSKKELFYTAKVIKTFPDNRKYLLKVTIPKIYKYDKIIVYCNKRISKGEIISFYTKLKMPYEPYNFFDFNEKKYFFLKNIAGKAFIKEFRLVQKPIEKSQLLKSLNNLPKYTKKYIYGLILGRRDYFSYIEKQSFFKIGIMHILAISGLHFGILILTIRFILSLFRLNIRIQWLLTLAVSFLYLYLIDFPISALRVFIMLFIYTLSKTFMKIVKPYQVLAISAIIVLLINGLKTIYNLSFIFSFIATFACFLGYELSTKLSNNRLLQYFITNSFINILLLPITIYTFNYIPILSFIANLFLIPFIPIFILSLWLIFSLKLISILPYFLISFEELFLKTFTNVIITLANSKYSGFYVFPFEYPFFPLLFLTLFLFSIYLFSIKKEKFFLYNVFFFFIFFLISCWIYQKITFKDKIIIPYLHKGSCVIFQFNKKTYVYIDEIEKSTYNPIFNILQKKFTEINYLIANKKEYLKLKEYFLQKNIKVEKIICDNYKDPHIIFDGKNFYLDTKYSLIGILKRENGKINISEPPLIFFNVKNYREIQKTIEKINPQHVFLIVNKNFYSWIAAKKCKKILRKNHIYFLSQDSLLCTAIIFHNRFLTIYSTKLLK